MRTKFLVKIIYIYQKYIIINLSETLILKCLPCLLAPSVTGWRFFCKQNPLEN